LRGLVTNAEGWCHFARGLPFKVAEQQRVAIRLAQFAERGVEVWRDVFPRGVGFGGKHFVHGGGLLFAVATADIGADGFGREVLGCAMQPAGQDGMIPELLGIVREGPNTPCVTSSAKCA